MRHGSCLLVVGIMPIKSWPLSIPGLSWNGRFSLRFQYLAILSSENLLRCQFLVWPYNSGVPKPIPTRIQRNVSEIKLKPKLREMCLLRRTTSISLDYRRAELHYSVKFKVIVQLNKIQTNLLKINIFLKGGPTTETYK